MTGAFTKTVIEETSPPSAVRKPELAANPTFAGTTGLLPVCPSTRTPKQMATPFFRFLVYTLLSMGRQTRFHMLPEDCRRFVLFLQERDPVIVTEWHSSELAEIQEVSRPWERGGHYCLWNQAILPALRRKATGKYFNIDFSAPVIEFTYEPVKTLRRVSPLCNLASEVF